MPTATIPWSQVAWSRYIVLHWGKALGSWAVETGDHSEEWPDLQSALNALAELGYRTQGFIGDTQIVLFR